MEYLSYRLPNRTGMFQEDLYQAFESNQSNGNYSTWAAGEDKPANLLQLTEDSGPVENQGGKPNLIPKGNDENAIALT